MKRGLAFLMVLCVGAAMFAFPAAAKEAAQPVPIVFVHGLGGWGEGAGFNAIMPHWGMLAGSVQKYLACQGYEVHAASVGPVSSAWDRACELYAHLTGTRVDYGAAHAAEHGHDRYGETYCTALMEDWSAARPIALLGHSFGGPTVNLFAQLCEQGNAAELAAGQAEISPLFTGELAGHILAIVTLSGTLNGSTAAEEFITEGGGMGGNLPSQMMMIAKMGMILPPADWVYPFRLGQFGVSYKNFYCSPKAAWAAADTFTAQKDCSAYDLTLDGAKELNDWVNCQKDIYYFSYAAQATEADADGNQVPKDFVWSMFKDTSALMGKKRAAFTTPGGITVDDSWLPNDGLVNVISQRYPFGEPHKEFNAANIVPGTWQMMPLLTGWDHVDFAGGMQKLGGAEGLKAFYLEMAEMLQGLAAAA